MSRRDEYLSELRETPDKVAFLRAHSGLPGPRANLELVQAAADAGEENAFREWIELGSGDDPTDEFLAVCGVVGLGRLVAEGAPTSWKSCTCTRRIPVGESAKRWRWRCSASVMRISPLCFDVVQAWIEDRGYVQRAAIAAVAEPRLLKADGAGKAAIDLVDRVTVNLTHMPERRSDEFRTLRQALAYCWSVVVAGDPAYGWPRMERWVEFPDPDVRWLMSQNLKKARLARLDPSAVERLRGRLLRP